MRIYITHCSRKKDDSLKHTGKKVTPDKLYMAAYIQRFMNKCKEKKVEWAIFSDFYGVWFPNVKHEWYDKDPNKVTEHEFRILLKDFDQKLGDYNEIYFYRNRARFHCLYKRLLKETTLKDRVILFSHKDEIV